MILIFSYIIAVLLLISRFIAFLFHVLSLSVLLYRSLCFLDVRLSHLNKDYLLTYLVGLLRAVIQ